MKLRFAGLWLVLIIFQSQASDRWVFAGRSAVTGAAQDRVYHHLDGSGRKHIAVTKQSVAAVWEDNRSQTPQIYATLKSFSSDRFTAALQVSDGGEAYEPSIDALSNNRFALAFEQDASVFARILTAEGLGVPTRLSHQAASHVSIASFNNQVFASWRERDSGRWFVKVAVLRIEDSNRFMVKSVQSVEAEGLETPLLFPAIAVNAAGLCVAWEDRRAGHTRLLVSHNADMSKPFNAPQSLNEFFSNRNEYDKGTPVSLASFGEDEILAAWMDKRRGGTGYGIFAALGADAGENFGPNEKCTARKATDSRTITRRRRVIRPVISSSPGTTSGAPTRTSGSALTTRIWNGARITHRRSPATAASNPTLLSPSMNRVICTCCG